MDSKQIFSENLRRHMELSRKTRKDISESLGISYYTVSDWVNGKKFPRMDKVEMLANLFGIEKSDLIEEESKVKKRNPYHDDTRRNRRPVHRPIRWQGHHHPFRNVPACPGELPHCGGPVQLHRAAKVQENKNPERSHADRAQNLRQQTFVA